MYKKFYIGICCLALLATSVASGYTEDFEGYTGNVGDQWDLTPEFDGSWVDLYKMKNNAPMLLGDTALVDLAVGYNSTQGVVCPGYGGGARLLPDPQGASGTFVYTAMMNMDPSAGRLYWGAAADLLEPGQSVHDFLMGICLWSDTAIMELKINGVDEYNTGFIDVGFTWNALDWLEVKVEIDTNASSRATTARTYYRDLAEDGSGPVEGWNQIDWGDDGGAWDLNMDGPDHKIEAIGFRADGVDIYYDNLVATVDPAFAELPGDVDGDGFIDNDDLNIILANWGKSGRGREGGDLNDNGVVDGPDYAEVLSYWTPPEPPEAAGVPEPVTLAILGAGGLLALFRRRRA